MLDKELQTTIKAIRKAGDYLKNHFRKYHQVSYKADHTELLGEDLKSEEILISALSKAFPGDSFFTEERETKITSDRVWVFDPICGSFSYLRGVETWSLSVALIKNEKYLIGVVYQPLLDNLFYSQAGQGAFLNGKKIKPSRVDDLSKAFISVEHAVFNCPKFALTKLIKEIKRIRVGHGSGGELAYVAAGFLDAVIKTDQTLMHFAGGRAIIEEAGGLFLDFSGKRAPTYFDKNKSINYLACNQFLSKKLLNFVNN